MRSAWRRLGLLGPLFLCLSGCWTTKGHLKPERPPEVFDLPPKEDARFDQPVTYPRNVMNTDRIKMDQERDNAGAPGMPQRGPTRAGSMTGF